MTNHNCNIAYNEEFLQLRQMRRLVETHVYTFTQDPLYTGRFHLNDSAAVVTTSH